MHCANCLTEIDKSDENIIHCTNCNKPMHKDCKAECIECGKPLCDTCSLANKFKCNNCTEEINIPFMTRSMYETYKTCPYKFYLRYIKEVPEADNIYAINGRILHELFEEYSVNPDLKEEYIYEKYREKFSKIPDDVFTKGESQKRKEFNKGLRSIKNYFNEEVLMSYPLYTEHIIEVKLDNELPMFKMTLDRLNGDLENKDLHLIDYKTGKVHVGKKLIHDLQPPLYALGIEKEFGVKPQTITLLFVSENKRRIYTKVSDCEYICKVRKKEYIINTQETLREIKKIWRDIKTQNFDVPSNMNNYICENRCGYRRNGVCGGHINESWKQINERRSG